MKEQSLYGQPRLVVGHQVKKLRAHGNVPASVYGRNVKSASLTLEIKKFLELYAQVGETKVIDLVIGSEKRPVLIHHVQRHPVDGRILHVEFLQVDLKQKVKTRVPIILDGQSPAVTSHEGVLLTLLDEIEVEALPRELPEKIHVDLAGLTAVGNEVKVSDISITTGVEILTDVDAVVVRIGALITREAEKEAAVEEAAAAATAVSATAPAATTPGESPKEPLVETENKPQ